jgi:hypothetical protein
MDPYRSYIKGLARENSDSVFFNSGVEYGSLVLSTMFENAQQSVKIYTARLDDVTLQQQECQTALKAFLSKGGHLDVLLQKQKMPMEKEPPIFNLINYYAFLYPDHISVKQHGKKLIRPNTETELFFAIADQKMYRVQENPESLTASCNFNDPERTLSLAGFFDDLSKDAVDYPLRTRTPA